MSALGRFKPFKLILAQCPLPGGKRPYQLYQPGQDDRQLSGGLLPIGRISITRSV